MNLLYQSAFAEALGWSLIDSLWQMGAIWAFYILITRNSNRFSADKRHSFALVGTAAGTLIFFISFLVNYYSALNHENFCSLAYFIEKQSGNRVPGNAFAETIIPLISFLYLPAVLFFTFRLILQVSINKNIYHKNLVEADITISNFVREMCGRVGIIRKVGVWISGKAESPLTTGFWKPVIILPLAVFSHLTYRQVEAVIAHELYHIKRNDYLINIYLALAEVILFFNPFARLMFGIVRKERENSCDDHVIASGFDAREYSQALYILGKYRIDQNYLALAATGPGKEYLLHRIRRIMKRNNPSPSVLKPVITFFLCLFVAGFAGRQKHIPVSADALVSNEVKPVLFYSVEKKITFNVPEKIKKSPPKTKVIKREKMVLPPEPPIPPENVMQEESSEDVQDLLNSYIDAPRMLEFTIIDPVEAEVPVVICETPQPYIQKSAFYFTEVDTVSGKKVISL